MRRVKFRFKHDVRLFYAAASLALLVLSCSDDGGEDPLPVEPPVSEVLEEVITVPFFIENDMGAMPTSPDEVIYEIRDKEPIRDMDGNHMTFGDFSTVTGRIEVTCENNGVFIDVTLSGLVPNGVYTLWHVTFNDGGADPSQDMLNIRGIGAVGKGDGSDNFFIASPTGQAHITALSPTPADLSMIGDIKDCPLTNEEEWHVVGSYHMDGKTWGEELGPDGTVVEQFGFVFKN
ncbi:hypothetical protein [Flagellimonas allohymeniacidonis]|uniref:Lipoprotein n=1 Tax=Flagellimonas allohymeniacidonis TaxID=2517819 RepID=A0A4V2HSY6_9FLAO|nr:hypothetical protein [Allomuricauda hymeniacidonis]TAI49570.1 hypothetical protein EW142_07160 [Allomuricauda hymeniacidonis]